MNLYDGSKILLKLTFIFLLAISSNSFALENTSQTNGDLSGIQSGYQYITITNQFNVNGPEKFVESLVAKLSRGTEKRKLAFAWEIHPVQQKESSIRRHIGECFRVAEKYDVPFLLHVNHEWLFPYSEINGDIYASSDMVEWVDWDKTKLKDWWSDWSLSFSGKPTRFPPRLTFNHPDLIKLLKNKSEIILSEIKNQIDIYGDQNFIGIDTGWETGIITDYKKQLPAYHALTLADYSKSSPPADLDSALAEISSKFIDTEISFYSDSLTPDKIFTHILVVEDERKKSQPLKGSLNSKATSGFSTVVNSHNMNKVRDTIGNRPWVITESWNLREEALKTLDGVGLVEGLSVPSMIVLYTWNVDIYNNPNLLNTIQSFLERNPPEKNIGAVKGYLDGFGWEGDELVARGWSCAEQSEYPLDLHFYADGMHPVGTHFLTARNNKTAEIGVHDQCKTSNSNSLLRFEVGIPKDLATKYSGKKLYVYGIHPSGEGNKNLLIGNSGNLSIPFVISPAPAPAPAPAIALGNVLGYIDSVSTLNNKVLVFGWACAKNAEQSIDLHIWAGPYPNGKHLITTKSHLISEPEVRNLCGISNPKALFRFQVELSNSQVEEFKGKPLVIYGIHPSGDSSKNRPLNNSERWKIP